MGRGRVGTTDMITDRVERGAKRLDSIEPRWRGDGKEIFYTSADGKMMSAEVRGSLRLEAGLPKALFDLPKRTSYSGSINDTIYDVTPDGQRFLIDTPVGKQDSQPITLVLNWTAKVKR